MQVMILKLPWYCKTTVRAIQPPACWPDFLIAIRAVIEFDRPDLLTNAIELFPRPVGVRRRRRATPQFFSFRIL